MEAMVDYAPGRERWATDIQEWRHAQGTGLSVPTMDDLAERVGVPHNNFKLPADRIAALVRFIEVAHDVDGCASSPAERGPSAACNSPDPA